MDEKKKSPRRDSKKRQKQTETPHEEFIDSRIIPLTDILPPHLFLLPVVQTSIFPGMIVPIILPEGELTRTVNKVMDQGGYVGVVLTHNIDSPIVATGPNTTMTGLPLEEPEDSLVEGASLFAPLETVSIDEPHDDKIEFYRYGVAAKIIKKLNLPDNQVSVLLSGLQRFKIKKLISYEPHFVGSVDYLDDTLEKDVETEALLRSVLSQFKKISKDNPLISEEVKVALVNIDGPGKLADLVASVLIKDVQNYQQFLSLKSVKERLQILLMLLKKERDVQQVQKQIHDEINQKVATAQREYYLNEQLKLIQRELGQTVDEKTQVINKYTERLKGKKLTEEAQKRIDEEIERLGTLHEQSSEYSVCLNYLDWATVIPWGVRSEENFSIRKAKVTLDKEHYGLKDVKKRILEYLAVKKLKSSREGSIICLVGPPGTGKTSLGKSVASALNRKFYRFSVGGMRDEAEIKGHRKTYVGAMPGKIIQGLKRVQSQNPVFLIDEIDKMGSQHSVGGDPASAMLELLDPEQNKEFMDHYLDIPFDCSEIFFITTANNLDTIPTPLLDRMEIIELSGYTDMEKLHIAKDYIIPRQIKKNALTPKNVKFTDKGILSIVSLYARESGVRNLEKQIEKICRKVAYKVAMGQSTSIKIDDQKIIEKFLGQPPYANEVGPSQKAPGVVTGLAWTAYGGEVLFVESASTPGKGGLDVTGSLGDVMQESSDIAYTFVRNLQTQLNIPKDYFENNSFHLHVPAGATPKDGPSAGMTMAISLISLATQKQVRPDVAMTGELTLSGRILPVGGIKEKLLAARRNKITTVLIPKDNARDLKEISSDVTEGLQILKIGHIKETLKHVFLEEAPKKVAQKRPGRASRARSKKAS